MRREDLLGYHNNNNSNNNNMKPLSSAHDPVASYRSAVVDKPEKQRSV